MMCYFLLFALIVFSGCGYTNKSLIAPDAKTIFVEPFKNSIDITQEASTRRRYVVYKPFLETKLTDAIIDRLVYDGNLRISDRDSADLLLMGEVIDYVRQPVKYSDAKDVLEYRLNLTVEFKVKDQRRNKIILEQKSLTADISYFVTGKDSQTEDSALDALLEDLARRVASRITHQW